MHVHAYYRVSIQILQGQPAEKALAFWKKQKRTPAQFPKTVRANLFYGIFPTLCASILLAGVLDGSLRSSQPGDRHAEGRAGNVGQADVVAELHGGGVAAMLAADA